MIEPNNALTKFRDRHCPNLSYDDPEIVYNLLRKLAKKNKWSNESEK